jgi:hypothetical protein
VGQKHAIWNVVLNGFPALGLLAAALVFIARRQPMTFFPLASGFLAVGLCCFIAAKVSVIRHGHFTSFGSGEMPVRVTWLYRLGYVLMACGAVGMLLFSVATN